MTSLSEPVPRSHARNFEADAVEAISGSAIAYIVGWVEA